MTKITKELKFKVVLKALKGDATRIELVNKYKILKIPTPINNMLNIIGNACENNSFSISSFGKKHLIVRYFFSLQELIL